MTFKRGHGRTGYTSERRLCPDCVKRNAQGQPVIDGELAILVHNSPRLCSGCKKYTGKDGYYHVPYRAPVQHELPNDNVFREHRARISRKRVG